MSSSNADPDPSPEMLPDVQPPTTGFILQLFIIPGLIVLMIVMIWLMIGWVADSGSNPQQYLAEIKRARPNSWQQALALAQSLQNDPESKNNTELARDIAGYLDALLDQPSSTADDASGESVAERASAARLRQFLCAALVNFKDTEVTLRVLVKAAGLDHGEDEGAIKVRVAAMQAIAKITETATAATLQQESALVSTLLAASEEDEAVLRSQSAIALGMLGTDAAVERLEDMALQAQSPNVRYNVATALARNGRESAIALLAEMLDPGVVSALPYPDESKTKTESAEETAQRLHLEKAQIMLTALQAVPLLAKANVEADLASVMAMLRQLPASDMPRQVKLQATQVLRDLEKRQSNP